MDTKFDFMTAFNFMTAKVAEAFYILEDTFWTDSFDDMKSENREMSSDLCERAVANIKDVVDFIITNSFEERKNNIKPFDTEVIEAFQGAFLNLGQESYMNFDTDKYIYINYYPTNDDDIVNIAKIIEYHMIMHTSEILNYISTFNEINYDDFTDAVKKNETFLCAMENTLNGFNSIFEDEVINHKEIANDAVTITSVEEEIPDKSPSGTMNTIANILGHFHL